MLCGLRQLVALKSHKAKVQACHRTGRIVSIGEFRQHALVVLCGLRQLVALKSHKAKTLTGTRTGVLGGGGEFI